MINFLLGLRHLVVMWLCCELCFFFTGYWADFEEISKLKYCMLLSSLLVIFYALILCWYVFLTLLVWANHSTSMAFYHEKTKSRVTTCWMFGTFKSMDSFIDMASTRCLLTFWQRVDDCFVYLFKLSITLCVVRFSLQSLNVW